MSLFDQLLRIQVKENDLKILFCRMVTPMALKLIRRFDGDIIGDKAIICNCTREEPSKDKNGRIVDGAFRIFFPNNQAICYTLSGEISFVL